MRPVDVVNRLYADFFMPSRLPQYRALLETVLRSGYAITSIESMWEMVRSGAKPPLGHRLVLRHDVDTDPGTARAMWQIDRDLGIRSSYFFRLSTIDIPLMRAIVAEGGEAGYHYEELATVAKQLRIRNPRDLERCMPEAQRRFADNLRALRASTGLPLRIVSSHGDHANRRLGVANWVLLKDKRARDDNDIELETYDEKFIRHVSSHHSDTLHPRYWDPESPLAAIRRLEPVVYLLVHPRHWRVNRVGNARDDLARFGDAVRGRLPP